MCGLRIVRRVIRRGRQGVCLLEFLAQFSGDTKELVSGNASESAIGQLIFDVLVQPGQAIEFFFVRDEDFSRQASSSTARRAWISAAHSRFQSTRVRLATPSSLAAWLRLQPCGCESVFPRSEPDAL